MEEVDPLDATEHTLDGAKFPTEAMVATAALTVEADGCEGEGFGFAAAFLAGSWKNGHASPRLHEPFPQNKQSTRVLSGFGSAFGLGFDFVFSP